MATPSPEQRRALVATCSRGLEGVLAEELRTLGAAEVAPGRGAVSFAGDERTLLTANVWLRTAMRVLWPLTSGKADSRQALYRLASTIAWESLVAPGQSMAVEAVGRSDVFRNLTFAAQVVKDAVVDRIRSRGHRRPNVDRSNPDLRLHLHLTGGTAALSLDATGEPLSHRGYRPYGGPAPLSEALAAGLLLLAGYNGQCPLLDPMCGSGTLVVEAALIATRTAPGRSRSFACQRWHWHDRRLLAEVLREAQQRRRPAPEPITGADRDPRAVSATRRNTAAAGVRAGTTVERCDVADLEQQQPGTLIVTNPPYGQRMGEVETLAPLYRSLGDALKQRAAGCTAWLLLGEPELARQIGLRPSKKIVIFNGPIECRFARYDLFEGSGRRR